MNTLHIDGPRDGLEQEQAEPGYVIPGALYHGKAGDGARSIKTAIAWWGPAWKIRKKEIQRHNANVLEMHRR